MFCKYHSSVHSGNDIKKRAPITDTRGHYDFYELIEAAITSQASTGTLCTAFHLRIGEDIVIWTFGVREVDVMFGEVFYFHAVWPYGGTL